MSDIKSFPKIFPVGSDYIPDLFKGDVEVTEKIDGSQFAFGLTESGKIVYRSRGEQIYAEAVPKMFKLAVDFVISQEQIIIGWKPGTFIYGEYLNKPKHNVLAYDRIPAGNIIVWGAMVGEHLVSDYEELKPLAAQLGLEIVPLLYSGPVNSFDDLKNFMELDSVLGGQKLEGIVVKNYKAQCLIGNMVLPSFGKLVREDFKERHGREWKATFGKKSRFDTFLATFRTEARWNKAVQHLGEAGSLLNDAKDIGPLLKEIAQDIEREERKNIEKELYEIYIDDITRMARAGFPEWYKERLAKSAFKEEAAV